MTLGVIIAIIALIIIFKKYRLRLDTLTAFTGGLGAGKTFFSVEESVKALRRARMKTAFYNALHPRSRLSRPKLYTSIPVRISRREYSTPVTWELLTLQTKPIKGSVCFLDEIDNFANQFEYENPNICKIPQRKRHYQLTPGLFDDFCRYFRHYNSSPAVESRLICNTQATANIVLTIRRRLNTVYTLRHFRKFRLPFGLGLFYMVRVYKNDISDESIVTPYDEANERVYWSFSFGKRKYDTHCYRHRADAIPYDDTESFKKLVVNNVVHCPHEPLDDLQITTEEGARNDV